MKKPIYKKTWFWIILIITSIMIFAPEPEEIQQEQSVSCEEYASLCTFFEYDSLLRTPEEFMGEKIKLNLKIKQKIEKLTETYYRCESLIDGKEYCIVDMRNSDINLLLDDIITVYGECAGTKRTTRALLGTTVEVPKINMIYCELSG